MKSTTKIWKKYFPSGFKNELKCLLELFFPCFLTNTFRFLNPLISLIMCGHLDRVQFDAASLAYSIINIFGENIDLGFSTAFDTLFSQIYGSNQKRKMGYLLQRAIIVMTLIYMVLICFHINIEPILIFFKQDPLISKLTAKYITLYLPGLFFDFQFLTMSRYLQNQNIVYPMMISAFISNIFNAISQFIIIMILGYGIEASACILSTANFLMFILQLSYVLISKVYKDTWEGFSFKIAIEDWKILFILGLPGIVMFSLKEWTFEISIFIAGSINDVQLGAQSIAFQCVTIAFTMIVGFGISVTIRIGQYLGGREIERIRTFLRTAFIVSITFSTICFLFILCLRHQITKLFSNDKAIQLEASKLLVYVSFFQLLDGNIFIFGGVLKASGRQFHGACIMFFSHYLVGVPIGVTILYKSSLNIQSMWIGLIVATIVEGVIFGYIVNNTNWDKECDKAFKNAESFKRKQLPQEKINLDKNSIYIISTFENGNKPYGKIIIIQRSVTIALVMLLLLGSIIIRICIPETLVHSNITT